MRRLITYIGTLRTRRILFLGSMVFLGALLLLVALVASLPALLSTSQLQSLLRLALSQSLKKPVTWNDLDLSWSRGMTLSGLTLGEGPPPVLGASVAELRVEPELRRDGDGGFVVRLSVRLKKLEVRLAPGPKRPPEKPVKDPLTAVAEAVQRFQSIKWPLPVDVELNLDALPMSVEYADPVSGRKVALQDLALHLAVPSLARRPIVASLRGAVALDDGKPQRLFLNAEVSDLAADKKSIRPAGAYFSADAALPGLELGVGGGVNRIGGLQAKLRLDLPKLVPLAAPLVKGPLPEVRGGAQLDLKAEVDKAGDLQILVDLCGRGLGARIPGKAATAGPLDFCLHQKVVSNHKTQQVEFAHGTLLSPGLLSASWKAQVDHPSERTRSVSAEIGPVTLKLPRARQLAAPFLPGNLPLQELEGTASIASITARLKGPGNDGEVTIDKVGVDLPQLRLRTADGYLQGDGIDLSLNRAVVPLRALLPTMVTADLSWGGKRLELTGKQRVLAQGMQGTLNLTLDKLEIANRPPAKMKAVADARQTVSCELLRVGDQLVLDRMRESLHLKTRALGGGEMEASLPELKLEIASLQANRSGKKVSLSPIAAAVTAEGVRLPAKGKGSPTLQRATCSVSAADALELVAEAGVTGLHRQVAASKGTAKVDLSRLMPVAAPFLPAGLSAAGNVSSSWDFSAPLPVAPLPKEQNPLRLARGALALLERGELNLDLADLDLRIPAAQGTYLVQGLSTSRQCRFFIPRAGEPLAFDAGFRFASLGGLSGSAGKLPLQGGTLTLQGELANWKELRLNEELKLSSLHLSQVAELTVNRIDSLLDDVGKLDTATLLRRLDATMFAHLEGDFPSRPTQVLPGLTLSGLVSAGARVDLTAARELRLRGYSKCRDLGVSAGKGMNAAGIRADLVVDRSYALAQGRGEEWIPLSAALVRPAPVAPLRPESSDLAQRIYQDLRGESSGPRKIGVRSASLKSGGFPLEASALEADLLLAPEAIGLSFVQAEVAGGSVRARGMIDLAREVPLLTTSCSFSRLDPAILFPAAGGVRPGEEGELTGEMSLSVPLVAEQRALLEGVRMHLNLRRFSSRILDRALFALDPYQRNEKIVAQRNTLKTADLKGLRVTALDGALDCEGELLVKGVAVGIPKVERLRLSELPIRKELEQVVAGIASSRLLLDLIRADTLVVGSKGELSLKRRNK